MRHEINLSQVNDFIFSIYSHIYTYSHSSSICLLKAEISTRSSGSMFRYEGVYYSVKSAIVYDKIQINIL